MYKTWIILACLALLLLGLFLVMPNLRSNKSHIGNIETQNLGTSTESYSTWKEFIPQSKLFKVMLPHPPQYAKDFISIPESDKKGRYDIYASEKIDGTLFLISMITYPDDIDTSSKEEIFKKTINELIQSKPENRVVSMNYNLYNNQDALDFVIENNEYHIQGKMMMIDKIIYILNYITTKGEFNPDEYQFFIDSFKFIKNESTTP